MTRLSADLDWCRHFTAFLTYQVVDSVVMFVATLTMFFCVSWQLTLALLAVTPLLMLITKLYSKKVHPLFVGMRDRLSDLNTAAQENIAGNRVVKAFAGRITSGSVSMSGTRSTGTRTWTSISCGLPFSP